MKNVFGKTKENHLLDDENCAIYLGAIVKYYRNCRNVSQQAVSSAISMNPSYYSQFENGRANITIYKLVSICHYLSVSPETIMHELYHFDENDIRFRHIHKRKLRVEETKRKENEKELLKTSL